MPSAKKKAQKSRQSASPVAPSPKAPSHDEFDRESLSVALGMASKCYPALIGESGFLGRVAGLAAESSGCNVWMSQASMVAKGIKPASLVSVSLPSSSVQISLGIPLRCFLDEYAAKMGIDLSRGTMNEVGDYFAIATIYPSCKISNDEVQLSLDLSYTMGCPDTGRAVFLFPTGSWESKSSENSTGKLHSCRANNVFRLCSELYLELASMSGVTMNKAAIYKKSSREVTPAKDRNIASPRSPIHQFEIPGTSSLQSTTSTAEDPTTGCHDKTGSVADPNDIVRLLKDETCRNYLQVWAKSCLLSRYLLRGNLVVVPTTPKNSIYRVSLSKEIVELGASPGINWNDSLSPETSGSRQDVTDALLVTSGTQIIMSLCPNIISPVPSEGLNSLPQSSSKCMDNTDLSSISLGGLDVEYCALKSIISSAFQKIGISRFGFRPVKGVLIHGPSGTGKTSLAQLCAQDTGVNLFSVNGAEIVSSYYGESERALRDVFYSASRSAPAMVLIDELDALVPARTDGGEELSLRLVATLLYLMDGITRNDGIVVIATTNRLDSIEPALRRPGRFDRELEIGVPSTKQRLDILREILSNMEHSLLEAQIEELAATTPGFVGADLAGLCNQAALVCLRRYKKWRRSLEVCPSGLKHSPEGSAMSQSKTVIVSESVVAVENGKSDGLNSSLEENFNLKITFEDFEKARLEVRPSAMREIMLEVPKVRWDDVGGQKDTKAQLKEVVEWPQKNPEAFERTGTRPSRGVLMFGPPGCSKTLMARAVASEAGQNFLAVKGPELFSKWVGESEKAVRSIFAKASANAPSIIFFDEIDGLAATRGQDGEGLSVSDRVISQLLVELDGLHQREHVTVIAATNRPDKIDPALLRPGRFDKKLYVGPPDVVDRQEIFGICLRKIPFSSDVSIEELARLTDGCTGADISFICREAALAAMEEDVDASEVSMRHFKTAIGLSQPLDVRFYAELSNSFERLAVNEVS
ncbi:hypothetical protein MLD38_015916 [Melastoma candidum]|uniref:Uncharacterized protein n=1 Tax=Melastoma candidum TaxID=119954 RepID=A0ACB9RGY9_9MYRT|nr:hypothetical protein MLD38_015916 [Melastoma candidum]